MGEKKYCEALTRYTEGLQSLPTDTSLLYNGGLATFQCKRYNEALSLWGRLKAVDPEDWQVRAKLIRTYQSLGKLSERDAERGALFELRKHDATGGLPKKLNTAASNLKLAVKGSWYLNILN